MTESLPDFSPEWMSQWKRAAVELPKIRDSELRQLRPADALEAISLLDVPSPSRCNPYENGLVIQQSWFMRQRLLQLAAEESSSDAIAQASSIGR
jgi:hypothetical protein